jgi:hypothetical protein
MSIRFQEKLLWSTKNSTPMITDRFDRTYMVVVMQLKECHESPMTQSDIGSPHGGGFHLFARQEGQRGGAVSHLWHNVIPQIDVSAFAQCVVIWIFGTAHFPLSLQG